jgi:PAS domain S-box-containing protein
VRRSGEVEATRRPARPRDYALALVASTIATALKVGLATYLVPTYILAYPAVMLAATLGGLGPGLLATAASAVLTWYWVLPPDGFGPLGLSDASALVLFMGMGVFISVLAHVYRRASHRAEMLDRERALAGREERYRALVENLHAGVVVHAPDTSIVVSNSKASVLLGLSPDQMHGKVVVDPAWRFVRDDGTTMPVEEYPVARVIATGKPVVNLVCGVDRPATGDRAWLLVNAYPEWKSPGCIEQVVVTFVDITERRRTEEVLAFLAQSVQSGGGERFFQDLASFLAQVLHMDFVCIDRLEGDGLTAQTLAVWCDGAFQDNVSYALKDTPCGDVVGREVCCFPASVCQSFPRDQVLQDLRAESYVGVTLWRHDGSPVGLIAVIGRSPLADPAVASTVLKMVAVRASNELERLEAERALRASEGHFRTLVQSLPVPVLFGNKAGEIITLNDRFTRVMGYGPDDIPTAEAWFRQAYPDESYRRRVEEGWERSVRSAIKKGGDVPPLESRVVCKGGEVRSLLTSAVPLGEDLIVTFVDITDRKRAEEALRESETRFRVLAQESPVGIFQTDARGQLVFANPTFLVLTGLSPEEARGPGLENVAHPEDRERVLREWQEALPAGRNFSAEYRHQLRDGRVLWVRTSGAPVRDGTGSVTGYVFAMADITETRTLQAQLALASRLSAMGTLVAGVAHEINNPLAAELSGQGVALEIVRKVQERLGGDTPVREDLMREMAIAVEALVDAQEGGERVARIVKDLAMFARPDPRRTTARLADIVKGAMRWLPASVSEAATVQVESQGEFQVLASTGQVEQVLVNLVTNAAKAMRSGVRGHIVVRTGPGSPGMVRLEVIDDGTGIDPTILDRVFEPFFTTRRLGEGKGAGLGLAISHAIASSHGGTLTVTSVAGKGSTFRMELPVAQADDSVERTVLATEAPQFRSLSDSRR